MNALRKDFSQNNYSCTFLRDKETNMNVMNHKNSIEILNESTRVNSDTRKTKIPPQNKEQTKEEEENFQN